jgi:hypoxanthine phosphoribosyltransferase
MNQDINYENVIEVPEEGLVLPGAPTEEISAGLKDRIDKIIIPEECIEKRVCALAKQISDDYEGEKRLYIIAVLKGAFVFASDLGREIDRHGGPELICDFYEAKTYGTEIKKSGEKEREVKILRRPRYIDGIDVLLVDDLNDTAVTLVEIIKDLTTKVGFDPLQVKTCVLLDKKLKNPPEKIKKIKEQFKIDYVGFEGPDRWVAGYGIDADEDFRLLRHIVIVNEAYYLKRS